MDGILGMGSWLEQNVDLLVFVVLACGFSPLIWGRESSSAKE